LKRKRIGEKSSVLIYREFSLVKCNCYFFQKYRDRGKILVKIVDIEIIKNRKPG
jgi:hypothetical protein